MKNILIILILAGLLSVGSAGENWYWEDVWVKTFTLDTNATVSYDTKILPLSGDSLAFHTDVYGYDNKYNNTGNNGDSLTITGKLRYVGTAGQQDTSTVDSWPIVIDKSSDEGAFNFGEVFEPASGKTHGQLRISITNLKDTLQVVKVRIYRLQKDID